MDDLEIEKMLTWCRVTVHEATSAYDLPPACATDSELMRYHLGKSLRWHDVEHALTRAAWYSVARTMAPTSRVHRYTLAYGAAWLAEVVRGCP